MPWWNGSCSDHSWSGPNSQEIYETEAPLCCLRTTLFNQITIGSREWSYNVCFLIAYTEINNSSKKPKKIEHSKNFSREMRFLVLWTIWPKLKRNSTPFTQKHTCFHWTWLHRWHDGKRPQCPPLLFPRAWVAETWQCAEDFLWVTGMKTRILCTWGRVHPVHSRSTFAVCISLFVCLFWRFEVVNSLIGHSGCKLDILTVYTQRKWPLTSSPFTPQFNHGPSFYSAYIWE